MTDDQAVALLDAWAMWTEKHILAGGWPSETVEARLMQGGGTPPGPRVPRIDMPNAVARVDRLIRELDRSIPEEQAMLRVLWYGWQWISPRLLQTEQEIAGRMRQTTEYERVSAWERETGCSRAKYYRARKALITLVQHSRKN